MQWYGGHPTLDYSVISPALGALVGPMALCAVSGLLSAIMFDRIVRHHFGSAWWIGSLWFAIGTATNLMVGRVAFAVGIAFGLATVLAIQHHLRTLALLGAVLTSLASPVAGLFVAIVATAWALSARSRRVPGIAIAAAACLPIAIVTLLFPDPGPFPYHAWGLVRELSVCALFIFAMRGPFKAWRWGAVVYAAVVVVAFLVPTALGGNVSRLGQYVGAPLIACALWAQRRHIIVLMVLPMVLWQWVPAMSAVAWAGHDPSTDRAYYTPLVGYIHGLPGVPGRVEIPFTYRHWESAYVAPEVALARGWERQLDIERNPIFYDEDSSPLNSQTYYHWLLDNAVEYVALPNTALDKSAIAERRAAPVEPALPREGVEQPRLAALALRRIPGDDRGLGHDPRHGRRRLPPDRLPARRPDRASAAVIALASERPGLRYHRRERLDAPRERAHRSRGREPSGVRRGLSV